MLENKTLDNMVKEFKEYKRMIEDLETEVEKIKEQIKAEMKSRGTDELLLDASKVTWKTVTSNKFDSKSFKKIYTDLYNEFSKPQTCKRFVVA